LTCVNPRVCTSMYVPALRQVEVAKVQRRAAAAEEANEVLERRLDEATARLRREHHARAAIEAQLRAIFARPVVKDALQTHIEVRAHDAGCRV